MIEHPVKTCTKCHQSYHLDRFYRDKNRRDGRSPWCKPCLHASSVNWRANNKERALKAERLRRERNPEAKQIAIERAKKWAKENPDQRRIIMKAAKHRRRVKCGSGPTSKELREWEISQQKVCHWCASECEKYEIDHVIPISKGGRHALDNLVISCRTCNRRKGALLPEEFFEILGAQNND